MKNNEIDSMHRLHDPPAEGRIVARWACYGVPCASYERTGAGERPIVEGRILEPASPIELIAVVINRAEGPAQYCGKHTFFRPEMKPPMIESDNGKPWRCSAMIAATTEIKFSPRWGTTAPRSGGYDKCDFTLLWADGFTWDGRFDMQFGGLDNGEDFAESVRNRIVYYSGLRLPDHIVRGGHAESFIRNCETTGIAQAARKILKGYEL